MAAFWKGQLQKAIQAILSSLARQGPTIIRLEDLHWADPSFLELIRLLLSESRDPILFLCVYRPIISLFTSHQVSAMTHPYREIRLQDLSISDSQGMVESLLRTETIPAELQRFLQDNQALMPIRGPAPRPLVRRSFRHGSGTAPSPTRLDLATSATTGLTTCAPKPPGVAPGDRSSLGA